MTMFEYFKDLVDQLKQVPGGPSVLRADYFAKAVRESVAALVPLEATLGSVLGQTVRVADAWLLNDGGTLCLVSFPEDKARLVLLHADRQTVTPIVDIPGSLLKAALAEPENPAAGYQVSPMILTMLAIAMGGIDDRKQLSRVAPEVDYCAKGLLLIASCRLCG